MRCPEEWALHEIFRAGEHLSSRFNAALKPSGVSFTQYNALRILQGEKDGLPSTAIGERMVSRDSDVTRLMDRLVKRGLVERERDPQDRRIVRVRLTAAGLALVEHLEESMLEVTRHSFAGVKAKRLRRLIEVLLQIQNDAGD